MDFRFRANHGWVCWAVAPAGGWVVVTGRLRGFNKHVQALGPFKLSATHIERLRLLATDFRYTLVPTEGGCVGDSVSGFSQPESKPTLFQRYCGKVLRYQRMTRWEVCVWGASRHLPAARSPPHPPSHHPPSPPACVESFLIFQRKLGRG